MKYGIPILAFALTYLLLAVGVVICFVYFGYVLIVASLPIFACGVLVITLLCQLILFLLPKQVKKEGYRFFYYGCLASSIALAFMYGVFSFFIKALFDLKNTLPEELKTDQSDDINPYFDLHLLLLLPILVQIILLLVRYKNMRKLQIDA